MVCESFDAGTCFVSGSIKRMEQRTELLGLKSEDDTQVPKACTARNGQQGLQNAQLNVILRENGPTSYLINCSSRETVSERVCGPIR